MLEKLRETLEDALPRTEAAAILFAALARWGPRIPGDDTEIAGFVRGALHDEVSARVPSRSLSPLLRALEDVLATAGAPTADHEIPIDVEVEEPPRWREEVSTKAMRSIEGPVPVLVVAATTAFALRLRLALGEAMVDVEARNDLPGVERALKSSALTVIDGRDPSVIPIDRLADALVHATTTHVVVWGSDTAHGRKVVEATDARGMTVSGIASSEGIGPIFDLVTSRRS